ncbi:helix-turn-helix domain-containing protein [Reichenbachiella versicolor]|uniref:helix-turn-helix domain-containing protein n=1 Tax=Reichenbachiella versicolor TaxID=1821036 RepID=UPI000D6DE99F|nr:helix-turn-helix domain-containing protein [Reichenbachiella versicolor]
MIHAIQNNEKITPDHKNLLILFGGTITIEKDGNIGAVPSRKYLFFDEAFEIIAASPFIEGYVVKIGKDELEKFPDVKEGLSGVESYFDIRDVENPEDKKSKIRSLLEAENNSHLVESYTHILWSEIIRDFKNSLQKKSVVEQFSELIDQNIEKNYCAGTYAEMMDIPLKKLIKEVKSSEHKTPCNFITQKVIEKAKYKLLTTDDTSQAIAYQFGFDDPYYFIKYFKRNTGLTPIQFRAQHSVEE